MNTDMCIINDYPCCKTGCKVGIEELPLLIINDVLTPKSYTVAHMVSVYSVTSTVNATITPDAHIRYVQRYTPAQTVKQSHTMVMSR